MEVQVTVPMNLVNAGHVLPKTVSRDDCTPRTTTSLLISLF